MVGSLLGYHPEVTVIPSELRFRTAEYGVEPFLADDAGSSTTAADSYRSIVAGLSEPSPPAEANTTNPRSVQARLASSSAVDPLS